MHFRVWSDGAPTVEERTMLWTASKIKGYAIAASDGDVGHVSDLLFDDASWQIRWLVVETGNWLAGRKVLLPVSTLDMPTRSGSSSRPS